MRRIGRADGVLCVVPPLAATLAAASVGLPRAFRPAPRLVVWLQDLVLAAARSVDAAPNGLEGTLGAVGRLEAAVFRAADSVLVCSPGFRGYLAERGVDSGGSLSFTTGSTWTGSGPRHSGRTGRRAFSTPAISAIRRASRTLVAAAQLTGPQVEVRIVGAGNASATVRNLALETVNVTLGAPVPRERFPDLLQSADVHVVIQRRVSAGATARRKSRRTWRAGGRVWPRSILALPRRSFSEQAEALCSWHRRTRRP